MKYVISLLLGAALGAVLFLIAILYNPLLESQPISPLTVTDARTAVFSYSAVPTDNLVLTNDGLDRRDPWPEDVLQLWERPIRQSEVMATVLYDARSQPTGLGIKFSSVSEHTQLLARAWQPVRRAKRKLLGSRARNRDSCVSQLGKSLEGKLAWQYHGGPGFVAHRIGHGWLR